MTSFIYHEKQVRELCALHALNNLFQQKDAFQRGELDTICRSLAPKVWLNPHKSPIGWGNYDINVIMTVLQNKGFEAKWFDKRKHPSCLQLDSIYGFIMNIPNEYYLGYIKLPFQRRHWIAIKNINGNYYNLDSKLKEPVLIGGDAALIEYFQEQLKFKDNQLFAVVESNSQNWQKGVKDETPAVST